LRLSRQVAPAEARVGPRVCASNPVCTWPRGSRSSANPGTRVATRGSPGATNGPGTGSWSLWNSQASVNAF